MAAPLSADQMAERFGKSPLYWARQARARLIPHHRFGRTIRFTDEDVAEILAASKVTPRPPAPAEVAPGSARHARNRGQR